MIAQAPADQWQRHELPDERPVALILGMDGDGRVGEHRLRAHGRDGEHPVPALERVVDLIEGVGDLLVDDLEVGDRRARARVPVDHVVVAVDQPLLIERDEDPIDGADVVLVKGESLALVITRRAEALVLLDDLAAVLLAPFPDALDECLAAEVVTRDALRAQLLLDDHLGSDAGVVGAEDPQRVAPPHAIDPAQRILDRAVERVAHVQRTGHVRRRDRDREVLLAASPRAADRRHRWPPRRRRCAPRPRSDPSASSLPACLCAPRPSEAAMLVLRGV